MIKRICKRCGKEFLAKPYHVKKWGAIYCSRDCSNKSTALREEKSPHWKGDNVGYCGIHDWLKTHYGLAKKCEQCGSKKNVQWAKIKGVPYKRRRENFWQLCTKCHLDYDGTMVKKGWNKGMPWAKTIREKISIGTKLGMKKVGYNVKL